MPFAICEDCGSLVEAELTHNGVCAVGHYVHCGWGHELRPGDLISDDVAKIIRELEAKLGKAVALLRRADQQVVWESLGLGNTFAEEVEAMIAELTGGKDD